MSPAGLQARPEEKNEQRVHQPHVVVKMHRVSVPKPHPVAHPEHVVKGRGFESMPNRDERGRAISMQRAVAPPAHHIDVMRNAAFARNIHDREFHETLRNHYYWHVNNGIRYAHFMDPHGFHWYGFYFGPRFYWTRYYADRWWWYDSNFMRWVYWYNGYWWWNGPDGVEYAYVENNYYPYQPGGVVTVKSPELQAPATNPEANEGSAKVSADGNRMVQLFGAQSEAFLYDKTGGQALFMKYLAQNVGRVRFSGGANGQPLEILLEFKDGTFAVFDASGNPIEAPATQDLPPAAPAPAADQQAPVDEMPSAPGQPPASGSQLQMPTSAPPPMPAGQAPSGADQPPAAPPAGQQ